VERVRRLLILVCVLVLVDTMLYAALTPLLGHFAHELHLSKGGAGVLVAAYAAGALLGGVPGGLAAVRVGPRRAVLIGLALMGVSSVAFAFADSFTTLCLARLAQGAGSAFTWAGAFAWLLAAAPRERRGEMIGTAMGAAVFGALFGPVVGAVADLVGRGPVFSALGVLSMGLVAMTLRIESAPPEHPSLTALLRALRSPRFAGGLAIMSLASLLVGILSVIAPLHLSGAGWSASAIGAVWLIGAAFETAQSPLIGRLSDRRGALFPVRWALAGSALTSAALIAGVAPLLYALLVMVASLAYGALFTPSFALIADGAEASGLAQGMAFGFMNAAWAMGAMVGPAAGGALATGTGDRTPLLVAAGVCLATLAGIRPRAPAGAGRVETLAGGE
jgi:MFS family permease